jgi:hypothetical protein
MISNPASFDTSLTEAERASFGVICRIIGATEGIDAFIGANPQRGAEAAVWTLDRIKTEDVVLVPDPRCYNFYGTLRIYGRDRAEVQRKMMAVVRNTPMRQEGGARWHADLIDGTNIEQMRVNGESGCASAVTVETMAIRAENGAETRDVQVWAASMSLEVVFSAGSKHEEE